MPRNIPATMKAVRLHGRGFENIKVDEIPVPEPNDDQLLVRVDAAGVCTSIIKLVAQGEDHTFINGWNLERFPIILGDEGSVTVVKIGKNLKDRYHPNARYVTQPAVDHAPINFRERYKNNAKGMEKTAVGYSLPGHLAEYMLVTEETIAADCLVPVPTPEIPLFAGALCEPLSCVISAQERHVHLIKNAPMAQRKPEIGLLRKGITVIIGAGPMGRLHAEAALRFKPAHLLIVDMVKERLAWVKELAEKAEKAGVVL
ncbi:MAG: alcohol dehydrogenase catalytic domain-containing protein, partial [Lentisphaerae bacterium]|nr:alcohol dehydrogenase catalytic domain-containing protein [Lentisphaerota bacterium]